jgi:CO/xanthine dehydrogenase FAD-binding subunit
LEDPACPELLSRVLSGVHSWQVRNETTVRRTLKASQLMPQWVAALLALGATVVVENDDGVADVALKALVTGRAEGDVKAVHVPRRTDMRWGEAHVARTPSDDPIVAAFAVVTFSDGVVEEAHVALTGVSSEPVWLTDADDALRGQALDRERIAATASAIEDEIEPQGDYLGSEAYRRAMASVLARRALEACAALPTVGGDDE